MVSLRKAACYILIVMVMASIMSFILEVRAEVYMLAPLISVVILLVITRDENKRNEWRELGMHKLGLKKWPFAVLAPIFVMSIVYFVLWATPYASFTTKQDMNGISVWMIMLKIIALVIFYTLTSSLGEEIGWRGYLLPKLMSLGYKKAFIITGVIHSVYHFPLIFTGSYHSEGNPWLVVPMFVITVISIGIIFGYIRIMTQSVWPVAIMHAVHNIAWAYFRELTEASNSIMSEYIGGESGLVALFLYGTIAILLLKKMKRRSEASLERCLNTAL